MRNSWAPRVVALVVLSSLCGVAFGHILRAERDGLFHHPRSFGKRNPVLNQRSAACPGNAVTSPANSGSLNGSDFGKCSTPQIIFEAGLDNRKETAFQPLDKGSFPHGSAQNIGVITQFTCDQLTNSCKANQQAKDLCKQAQTAANAATPAKTGIQADVFNKVFGNTTQFAQVQPISDTGVPVDLSNGGIASPTTTNKATPTTSNPASTSSPPPSTGNLQKFTGSLGGVSAPPVTALGNGQFQVQGNAVFKDQQNALTRSCDVQHNKCADAANASGNKGELTVDACGKQQTQCNAAKA